MRPGSKKRCELAVIEKGNVFGHEEIDFNGSNFSWSAKRDYSVRCFTNTGKVALMDI
jgi:hypothetical protein